MSAPTAHALERAVLLERLTIVWMTVTSVAGLVAGAIARSVSLTAFGLDSAVELSCAVILLRRLVLEMAHGSEGSERHERQAAQVVGALLLVAAAYIAVDAVLHLARRQAPGLSGFGIGITLVTIPVMVPLAGAKLKIAGQLASRALRADAIGNVVVWYLAAVVLVSLVAETAFHLWWLDGVASLVIVVLLTIEGIEAVRGAEIRA